LIFFVYSLTGVRNKMRHKGVAFFRVQKTKKNKAKTQTQNNVLDTMETTTKNINKTLSLPPTNNLRGRGILQTRGTHFRPYLVKESSV
jgi:hypothetical protein